MDGSSMASPHITGLAALLLEAKPSATIDEIENALYQSCTVGTIPTERGNRGFPDAVRAFEALTGTTLSDSAVKPLKKPAGPAKKPKPSTAKSAKGPSKTVKGTSKTGEGASKITKAKGKTTKATNKTAKGTKKSGAKSDAKKKLPSRESSKGR